MGVFAVVSTEPFVVTAPLLAGAGLVGASTAVAAHLMRGTRREPVAPDWDRVLDRVGSGRWEWNVDARYSQTSTAWNALFGYTDSPPPVGPWWNTILHPDDLEAVRARVHDLLDGRGSSAELTCRLRRANGLWVDVLARVHAERGADEKVHRLFGTHEDISDRRRRERELISAISAIRESEDRVRSYVDYSPIAVLVADRSGRYVDANPAALDLVGYDLPSLLRLRVADLAPEPLRDASERTFATVLATGRGEGEFPLRHRNGHPIWVYVRSVRISGDRVLSFCPDVTERRLAARELEEREARYRAVIETSGDGFLITDTEGRILEANDAYVRRSGYTRTELTEMRLSMLDAGDGPEETAGHISRVLREGADTFETLHRTLDGNVWSVELSVSYWPIDGGRLFAFARDIRERKRSESLLRMRLRLSELAQRGQVEPLSRLITDEAERFTASDLGAFLILGPDEHTILRQTLSARTVRLAPDVTPMAVVEAGWNESVRARRAIVDNDHRPEPGFAGLTLGGLPVRRFVAVPILREGGVVALIVVANKASPYTPDDVAIVTELASIGMDTIGRLQAEEKLRLTDTRFRQMADTIGEVFWLANAEMRSVLYVNSAFERLFGVKPETLTSDAALWRSLVHPEDLDAAIRAFAGLAHGESHDIECRIVRADGTVRWVSSHGYAIRDDSGDVALVSGVVTDITTRKQAELTLEAHQQHLEKLIERRTAGLLEAEARTRLILESTADGILGVGADGVISFANPAASQLTGLGPAALVGRHITELVQMGGVDPSDLLVQAYTEGRVIEADHALLERAANDSLPIEMAFQPMFWEGQRVGGVITFRDVSAHLAAESARTEALAAAQRLAQARSEFLANMSHEIRTPLNAVLGFAQLGHRTATTTAARTNFNHILEAGQHLIGIIDEILSFSKIEAGRLSIASAPYNPAELIDRVVGMVATAAANRGIDLHVDESPNLPTTCQGDLLRLCQVLVNLLGNAVKFTDPGGSVGLQATFDDGLLLFRVTDTGIGISDEQLGRLFRPFEQADSSTTRKYGGTGLGLAITHRIVAAMGGEIHVTSAIGAGSVFEVRLPVMAEGVGEPLPRARVCALGLRPRELEWLAGDAAERGLLMVPEHADPEMVVVSGAALVDLELKQRVEALMSGPAKLFVVARSTDRPIDTAWLPRIQLLHWPLRLRHLVAASEAPEALARSAQARLHGIRVLVAEDNLTNQAVLDGLLTSEGAELVCVTNGPAAIERVVREGADRYHIFITDIHMPGMDGYETARGMRAIAPDLAIVGLTADALPSDRERCLEAGMVQHLSKPVELEPLVTAVLKHHRRDVAPKRPSLINWTALEQSFTGRKSVVDKLVAVVHKSEAGLPARISTAVANGDYKALAFVAHSLAGMAGNLRAEQVMHLARQCEFAAREERGEALVLGNELVSITQDLLADVAARAEAQIQAK